MQNYMDDENLMPKEQKGCCRGSKMQSSAFNSNKILKNINAGKRICVWHGLITRKHSTSCHKGGNQISYS